MEPPFVSALNPKVSMAGTMAPKPPSTGAGLIEDPAQRRDPDPHQRTITPDHVLSPAEWDLALNVNVRAHIAAAERLLPGWLERGSGYFLTTASAAGIVSQIGSAPYAVTKHAALAFAEWLSITYGARGVGVSCLCPMGVNTPLLNDGLGGEDGLGFRVVAAASTILEPEQVADAVVDGLAEEGFLILPHPEVLEFFQRKAADYDRWLAGMRRLQARVEAS